MTTAQELYEYFLVQIRKERNTTVSPTYWTNFVNPIVLDWVKTKLPTNEFSQKRIDDLESIKVLTNGLQYPYYPSVYEAGNIFKIPFAEEGYPAYMHGVSVQFGNQEIEDDGISSI